MKKLAFATLALLLLATPSFAATKTYQVTGPVVALDDNAITVKKGSEKWEIDRSSVALPASVAVGSKVTVQYYMTATAVADKDAGKKAK